MTSQAVALKEQGNEAIKKKNYDEAIRLYGEAIALSKSDHVLYSNRSAAYAEAKRYEEALCDAQKCIELKPDFAKGYSRLGWAQEHLKKLMDAKRSYLEGLKYDSKNTVMTAGLRRCFLAIVNEAAETQRHTQHAICEATHEYVAAAHTSLSFLEAYQKIIQLKLPDEDTLDQYGISPEDFQQTVGGYAEVGDAEVMNAVQSMFAPAGKADADKASKIDKATLLDVHTFMVKQMESIVEEFNQLPAESVSSMPKKQRENAAELLVSVAVESSFKIRNEDIEEAMMLWGEQLQDDATMIDVQTKLASLMERLKEPPFVETRADQALKAEAANIDASSSTTPEVSGSMKTSQSQIGTLACRISILSALGLVVIFGIARWRKTSS